MKPQDQRKKKSQQQQYATFLVVDVSMVAILFWRTVNGGQRVVGRYVPIQEFENYCHMESLMTVKT